MSNQFRSPYAPLNPPSSASITHLSPCLTTLHSSISSIPSEVAVANLDGIIDDLSKALAIAPSSDRFFQLHGTVGWPARLQSDATTSWKELVEVVDIMQVRNHGKHKKAISRLLSRLASLCEKMHVVDAALFEYELKRRRTLAGNYLLPDLCRAAERRFELLLGECFVQIVKQVVEQKRFLQDDNHGDQNPLVMWAMRLMSAEVISAKVTRSFHAFLACIPDLSPRCLEAILSGLGSPLVEPESQSIYQQIEHAVSDAMHEAKLNELRRQVRELEMRTAVVPPLVESTYSVEGLEEYPTVQRFVESKEMELRWMEFGSVVKARKVVKAIGQKLGEGFQCIAGGKGKKSYVDIKKPGFSQYEQRKKYLEDLVMLEKVRTELRDMQCRSSEAGQDKKRLRDGTNENRPGFSPGSWKRARLAGKENVPQYLGSRAFR